jgi:transposase-like protein
MPEIHRRTRVVGDFPGRKSAVMLVAARLRHIAGTRWGKCVYLDMDRLREISPAGDPLASRAQHGGESNGTKCVS